VGWDWGYALEILPRLLEGLVITVEAALFSYLLAVTFGLVLAILLRSHFTFLVIPLRYFLEFIRRTPGLVQLYFLFFVLPDIGINLSPMMVGILGLGFHYSTYFVEIYRAGIDGVPAGQWDASTALNYSRRDTWVHVILPQAIPPMIPAMANILIMMFKVVPILSALTVLELMGMARAVANQTYRYVEPMTLAGLIYLIIGLPATMLARRLERHYRSRIA
jgi:polar amino acid transport system permease protein